MKKQTQPTAQERHFQYIRETMQAFIKALTDAERLATGSATSIDKYGAEISRIRQSAQQELQALPK